MCRPVRLANPKRITISDYWGAPTPCLQYCGCSNGRLGLPALTVDSLLRTDPFLRNYSVFDWLTSVRATGSVGPTHGSGTVSTAALANLRTEFLAGLSSHTDGHALCRDQIAMDNTSNRYPVDWIREQWMSLYTPENCQSHCATPAALINVYRSIEYSAHQMVGAFNRDNHSTAAAKTLGLNYVVPYTNARGVIWDEDTAQFMDEWSEYDVADPRWEPDAIQRKPHDHCWHLGCILPNRASNNRADRLGPRGALPAEPERGAVPQRIGRAVAWLRVPDGPGALVHGHGAALHPQDAGQLCRRHLL